MSLKFKIKYLRIILDRFEESGVDAIGAFDGPNTKYRYSIVEQRIYLNASSIDVIMAPGT